MKRIQSDRIVWNDRLFSGYIYFENGKIVDISNEDKPVAKSFDMTGYYVTPGFIDIHTHGGGGHNFSDTADEIIKAAEFHLKHGTTTIAPTVSAAYFETMQRAVEETEKAMADERFAGTILGAHLEGPYLSIAQAGAQGKGFITDPIAKDYLPLIEAHKGAISRWTYAPENDKDAAFAKALQENGIVASAGHTDAIYDDMKLAKENGCNLITHLYSCTSTVKRDHGFRRLGVIESAYLWDDMYVEIICDGKHLPPELIQMIYRIKGADKIALITDSLSLAGTDVKQGIMHSTEYIIEDGVCKLLDRSAFAGSIATADRLLQVAVKDAGISLFDAVKMMTATPAAIMGLDNKGVLATDADADFAVLDDELKIKAVFAKGQKAV
ncbi:MAG: N-acetylglucosamine-6-phosphate deacetylase [Clostridia bacterium]|nr:N-acetylglucosamine-6-phosphate deacetylase [Clostridia bacterium]